MGRGKGHVLQMKMSTYQSYRETYYFNVMMYQKLKVAKLLEGEGALREKRGHSSILKGKLAYFLCQKGALLG